MAKPYTLHFSPKQSKSGLLVYHHDGYTLNLLVLPKMWREANQNERQDPWQFVKGDEEQTSLSVVAYEGEYHVLDALSSTEDDKHIDHYKKWKILLESLAETLIEKAKQEPDNTSDDFDNAFDKDVLKSLNALMKKHTGGGYKTDFDKQNPTLSFESAFTHLFKLSLFCEDRRKDFDMEVSAADTHVEGVSLDSSTTPKEDDNIYRLIAIQNYVREIEAHIHQIHQGYVPTVETLDSIRGSVTGTSLMMLDAGVSLKPKCRYNKFIPNIPLFQILVTTLDSIAKGFCFPNSPFITSLPITTDLKNKAMRLRIKLSHITSLPLQVAQYRSERIALNRLQQHWKPALQYAKILLKNKPIQLRDSTTGDGGYMWTIDTSKIWESILTQALQTQFKGKNDRVLAHVKSQQPWDGLGGNPDADIVVSTKECLYIFDAKYKIDGRKNKGSSKTEEYQMFAYSHLIDRDKKDRVFDQTDNKHLGLVYPTFTARPYPDNRSVYTEESKKNQSKTTVSTFWRETHNTANSTQCSLSLYYLPFPSLADVETQKNWTKRMKGIGEQWTGIKTDDYNTTEPFSKKWDQ